MPLFPQVSAYGISASEHVGRLALHNRVQQILNSNRLLRHAAAKPSAPARRVQTPKVRVDDNIGELDAALPAAALPEVQSTPTVSTAAAFDQLQAQTSQRTGKKQNALQSLGRVADLKLDAPYSGLSESKTKRQLAAQNNTVLRKRTARKELSVLPQSRQPAAKMLGEAAAAEDKDELRIKTFTNEFDPFELNLLDSGHFVLFRNVWRNGKRYIQGH